MSSSVNAALVEPGVQTIPGYSMGSVAFWGFLLTQFLGAFNDNYFKQMVLLTSISQVTQGNAPDRQPIAMIAFAMPFVLLSGLGGFLSDRWSKQRVIVGSKVAEVGIMGAALVVLLVGGLSPDARLLGLIAVLMLMGAQSAIFAPSKYGVLPELFRADQLRPVNGAVQMTTFLAILFGTVGAGIAMDQLREQMWVGSLIAIGIAVLGTVTSIMIPWTRVAEPNIVLKQENLFVPSDIAELMRRDRDLTLAILVSSVFWFLGGVTQMAVNTLGKASLQLSDTRTSLLVAGIGFGIMGGCLVAGFLGKGQSGHRWVTSGAWLLLASLLLIGGLGSGRLGFPANAGNAVESILSSLLHADLLEWMLRFSMVLLGVSAGMFLVPIQVFLQQAPPAEFKGRLLGVQNLATWIGILLSAAFVFVSGVVLRIVGGPDGDQRYQWAVFVSLAVMMLPVCLFYRLPVVSDASDIAASSV
jgi:acyl-[acyl-carrier-protein]-phospholipid O-acyltransferase/long-chain-fatty-acid--[acyl-carrier-protein] ligase